MILGAVPVLLPDTPQRALRHQPDITPLCRGPCAGSAEEAAVAEAGVAHPDGVGLEVADLGFQLRRFDADVACSGYMVPAVVAASGPARRAGCLRGVPRECAVSRFIAASNVGWNKPCRG
jgi:hypothetical protein